MSSLESVKSVFKERIFKIPDYQRGYAWQRQQLNDFWEDLINLPAENKHYTGMLTLKKACNDKELSGWEEENWLIDERDKKPFYVVDGQQRLTTIVIFLNEIIHLVKNNPQPFTVNGKLLIGTEEISAIEENYLVVTNPKDESKKTFLFSYETDNPSFKYLKHRVLLDEDSAELEETLYTQNLATAKAFFREQLNDHFSTYGAEGVEMIFKKLTQSLQFNLHEISDDFDVFVAFETMNNRGKKLSYLELLKNRMIYLTTLYGQKDWATENSPNEYRQKINDAWKEVYHQLGRDVTNKLVDDDFLRDHWRMHFRYSRNTENYFDKFLLGQHFVPQNVFNGAENRLKPEDINDYVTSLKDTASQWYYSHYPYDNKNKSITNEERRAVDRLNRLGMVYFRPLVVALYLKNEISSDDRLRLLKEIERFIMLEFKISGRFSTYMNSKYYKIAHELYRGKSVEEDIDGDKIPDEINVDSIIRALGSDLEVVNPKTKVLRSQGFREKLGMHFRNGKGYYEWGGIRYLLYEYEQELDKEGDPKIKWDEFSKVQKRKEVSIEHIYPQTPEDKRRPEDSKYWVDHFGHHEQDYHNKVAGSLGNLLALSRSKNAELQNYSFDKKKNGFEKDKDKGEIVKGYNEGSYSENEVAKEYSEWNLDNIRKRGLKLLSFMETRWDFKFEDGEKESLLFLPSEE
jgi:uncharacterized protein with ParB-like and HNH nuclease domain